MKYHPRKTYKGLTNSVCRVFRGACPLQTKSRLLPRDHHVSRRPILGRYDSSSWAVSTHRAVCCCSLDSLSPPTNSCRVFRGACPLETKSSLLPRDHRGSRRPILGRYDSSSWAVSTHTAVCCCSLDSLSPPTNSCRVFRGACPLAILRLLNLHQPTSLWQGGLTSRR